MSLARLVITAVVVQGCRAGEVAVTYKVARSWVYELVARYRAEGDAAEHAGSDSRHSDRVVGYGGDHYEAARAQGWLRRPRRERVGP